MAPLLSPSPFAGGVAAAAAVPQARRGRRAPLRSSSLRVAAALPDEKARETGEIAILGEEKPKHANALIAAALAAVMTVRRVFWLLV